MFCFFKYKFWKDSTTMILADCGLNFGFTTTCLYSSGIDGLIRPNNACTNAVLFIIDSFFLKGIIAILSVLWTLHNDVWSSLSHTKYSLGSGAQKRNIAIIIIMMFFFTLSPPFFKLFSSYFNFFHTFTSFYVILQSQRASPPSNHPLQLWENVLSLRTSRFYHE